MPEKNRYLVEGAYLSGNDGNPITGDYVVAISPEDAKAIVKKVRDASYDNWMCECVHTFEEHIASERLQLDQMEAMSLEDVEESWADTKDNLYYEEEEEEEDAEIPCNG